MSEGRDLTAALIEIAHQETFANRTRARSRRLSPRATTSPPRSRDHARRSGAIIRTNTTASRSTSSAARQPNGTCWCSSRAGRLRRIRQRNHAVSSSRRRGCREPSFFAEPSALLDLRLERSLTLARDIEVTVKSWNSRQQSAFAQTARRCTGRGSVRTAGLRSDTSIVRPNLTSDQALQLAQQMLAELTRHERVICATMPGELHDNAAQPHHACRALEPSSTRPTTWMKLSGTCDSRAASPSTSVQEHGSPESGDTASRHRCKRNRLIAKKWNGFSMPSRRRPARSIMRRAAAFRHGHLGRSRRRDGARDAPAGRRADRLAAGPFALGRRRLGHCLSAVARRSGSGACAGR